ncbi:hypothetical protein OSB04_029139 [Centaurea solstitialis]|uniref:Uncharacterized protein n=1 Tax=Centaurea solstitialis TaxID=347529 RepID=A0AA38T1V2_9ASTR|nr:hypothetical protein OSB04_029139 [Centaurea solstitialis]
MYMLLDVMRKHLKNGGELMLNHGFYGLVGWEIEIQVQRFFPEQNRSYNKEVMAKTVNRAGFRRVSE